MFIRVKQQIEFALPSAPIGEGEAIEILRSYLGTQQSHEDNGYAVEKIDRLLYQHARTATILYKLKLMARRIVSYVGKHSKT